MAKLTSRALLAMAGTAATKARDHVARNPDRVEGTLDQVRGAVSDATHGKSDAHLNRGTTVVRKGLDLPGGGSVADTPGDPDPETAEPPPSHGVGEPVAPNPAPGTSDDPQPRRRDDEPAPLTPGERPRH